jgi:hypothetical protein
MDNFQDILVYFLFTLAVFYFSYRFFQKNLKKSAKKNGKACGSDSCGCP